MRKPPKTAYDLLSEGFKKRPVILTALKLGETKIPISKPVNKNLSKAIENNDYYEIKTIIRSLHKSKLT